MRRQAFIQGAMVFGLAPGIVCSLAAAQWGVMPGECFVACMALGGLAGLILTPRSTARQLILPAPSLRSIADYHTQFCVFGRRGGVEL